MATLEDLQQAVAGMQAAMEEQRNELLALRQSSAIQMADFAEERKSAAEERKTLLAILASRSSSGADDVVDGKGVGQPSRLVGRKDDFAEFTHKFRTFLTAKLGQKVASLLKWAQQQRKVVVSSSSPGDREVSTHTVFGRGAGEDEVANLETVENRIYVYLTSFTSGEANKIVRNVGDGRGLEAWRRLHAEYDPTSSIRRVAVLGKVQNPPRCEKIEDLGKALGDWTELRRQYEDFTDEGGNPCKVGSDSLMAAMYKIMPKALEETVMFKAEDFGSFDALYDRLIAYAGTKHSMSLGDSTARPQTVNKDLGTVAGNTKDHIQCWECGEYGHYGRDCPWKGRGKGKAQGEYPKGKGKAAEKGKGKSKGQGAEKGKGKGKGKGKKGTFNSFGDEGSPGSWLHDQEYDWQRDHGWWGGSEATTTQKQPEEEEEAAAMFNIDVCAVDAPGASKPKYIVEHNGEDWIRFNYDTGASTVALPGYLAEDVALEKIGDFTVASGDTIPNLGRVAFKVEDENGVKRGIKGSVTSVHKPLGGGAEIARNMDSYVWDTGGVLLPRGGPVARGLEKEYNRLAAMHGTYGKIDLHREGNLYNFYVKKVSKAELAPVSQPEQSAKPKPSPVSKPEQGSGWKSWPKTSKNLVPPKSCCKQLASKNQWADLEDDREYPYWGTSACSGFTWQASP